MSILSVIIWIYLKLKVAAKVLPATGEFSKQRSLQYYMKYLEVVFWTIRVKTWFFYFFFWTISHLELNPTNLLLQFFFNPIQDGPFHSCSQMRERVWWREKKDILALKVLLTNAISILMRSLKLDALGFLEITVFEIKVKASWFLSMTLTTIFYHMTQIIS